MSSLNTLSLDDKLNLPLDSLVAGGRSKAPVVKTTVKTSGKTGEKKDKMDLSLDELIQQEKKKPVVKK
jgi:hypothetical protein